MFNLRNPFYKDKNEETRAVTPATVDNIFKSTSKDYISDTNSISTAYSCVRLISQTVAMTSMKNIQVTDKGEETLTSSRLTSLLKNPERNITYFKWMRNMVQDLVGKGNGYSIIIRESGAPIELLFVEESSVSVYVTQDMDIPYYYQLSYRGKSWKLYPEDVLHFSNITYDGYTGMSPLSVHRATFEAASAINNYNKVFMDNSANIVGVIETDKKLNKEAVEDLRNNFSNKFSGSKNAGKTPVLPEGLTYKQMKVISPMDASYIETKKLNKQDIAEIYGVPLTMLGDTSATYSNAEQLSLIYQQYTINPIYTLIEEEMSLKLIPYHKQSKQRFEFAPDTLKLASNKERAETISLLKNSSIITVNEGREYYGKPKITGGDVTVDVIAQQAAAQAAQNPSTPPGQSNKQAPKNSDSDKVGTGNNSRPEAPRTDSNIKPSSKRSLEEYEDEIQKLKSELGRMKKV